MLHDINSAEFVAARRRYKVLLRQRDALIAQGCNDCVLDDQLKCLVDAFPSLAIPAAAGSTGGAPSPTYMAPTTTALVSSLSTAVTPPPTLASTTHRGEAEGVLSDVIRVPAVCARSETAVTSLPKGAVEEGQRSGCDVSGKGNENYDIQAHAHRSTGSMPCFLMTWVSSALTLMIELRGASRRKTSFRRAYCVLLCALAMGEALAEYYTGRTMVTTAANMIPHMVLAMLAVVVMHMISVRRVRRARGPQAVWPAYLVYVAFDVTPSLVLYSVVYGAVWATIHLHCMQ